MKSAKEVERLTERCHVCGDDMDLVHSVHSGMPRAWFCAPCYSWTEVTGEASRICRDAWVGYLDARSRYRAILQKKG